ncbi:hypothetical protein BH09MYX1_BH09MYX1_03540 [soil metagenome]
MRVGSWLGIGALSIAATAIACVQDLPAPDSHGGCGSLAETCEQTAACVLRSPSPAQSCARTPRPNSAEPQDITPQGALACNGPLCSGAVLGCDDLPMRVTLIPKQDDLGQPFRINAAGKGGKRNVGHVRIRLRGSGTLVVQVVGQSGADAGDPNGNSVQRLVELNQDYTEQVFTTPWDTVSHLAFFELRESVIEIDCVEFLP